MPAHKKYDAVATIGTYKDRNGDEKKRYTNVGTVFENEDGRLSLKLDTVPVGQEWSGWISFFEPKERDGQQGQGDNGRRKMHGSERQPSQHQQAKQNAYQPEPQDDGDDIPF